MDIKESFKQFVKLLLLGQVFLVGAVIQERHLTLPGNDEGTERYSMRAVANTPANLSDTKDRLAMRPSKPLPEVLGSTLSSATYSTKENSIAASLSSTLSSSLKNHLEEVSIKEIIHREGDPFQMLIFELLKPVRFTKVTHRGKLLRLRVSPPLSFLARETTDELNSIFGRFSQFRGPRYSEYVFYAKGKIGDPYLATSSAGLAQLVIPFQTKDTDFPLTNGKTLAEGVTYYRDRVQTSAGGCDVFILRVDPSNPSINIVPVLANEGICQKEVLSSIGRRYDAIAAINGAYFTPRGDPIGTLIINRKLVSSPLYGRSVFGISTTGELMFGNPDFSGTLKTGKVSIEIDAVNQPRTGNRLVIYTPEFARSTRTTEPGKELVVIQGRVVGIHDRDAIIPPDGVVVSAGESKADALENVRLGDSLTFDYRIDPPWNTVRHAVCGGPRLLREGKIDINGKEEKFDDSIVYGRHPRTAVAQTFNGELLFVVVDGRSSRSAGMTLKELANYLKRLGGRSAINLDGGGSSSMLINGKIVNKPSDGKERPISNGIVITQN